MAHEPEIPLGGNDRFLPRSGSWGLPAATFAAAASAGPGAAAPPDARPPSDYRLFRFLDFHVEPGKYYMYRVSLVLANPNHKLKPTLLSDAAKEYGEKIHLQTEWSKPSGVVSVPGDTAVLLMAVTPPATKSGDPSATVLVTKWLMDRGAEEHKKLPPLLRGQIANFSANPSKISNQPPGVRNRHLGG